MLELRKQGLPARQDRRRLPRHSTTRPVLDKKLRHDIDVVVDRIVVREGIETRLADSLRTALDLASGIAVLETAPRPSEGGEEGSPRAQFVFSENFACPVSGFTIPEIEPRLFSFNAPFGACPACGGLGAEIFFDERLVVPDAALTLANGALAPWRKGKSPYFLQTIQAIAEHYGFDPPRPPGATCRRTSSASSLRGSGEEDIAFRYGRGRAGLPGLAPLRGRHPQHGAPLPARPSPPGCARSSSATRTPRPCGACGGYRLRPEALAVRGGGPPHRPGDADVDPRGAGLDSHRRRAPDAPAPRDRPRHPQGDSASGWASSTTWGSNT